MADRNQEIAEMLEAAQKLIDLWLKTKAVMQRAFSGAEITQEHEAAFMQIKSEVSRVYRGLAKKLPKGLLFEGEKMIEMLKNAMTVEHMKRQPPTERAEIMMTWHNVYVRLARTVGALETMKAGYFPSIHREKLD